MRDRQTRLTGLASFMFACVVTACAGRAPSPAPSGSIAVEPRPLAEAWKRYTEAPIDQAPLRIDDPRDASFFLNAIPPGGRLARALIAGDEQLFGDFGQLMLEMDGKVVAWLVMRRGVDGVWRLTLNEKPVLDALTRGWLTTPVGKLTYHSRSAMNDELRRQAEELSAEAHRLEEAFGLSLPGVDYYLVEPGPRAMDIAGEINFGAGQARRRLIKAVGVADHGHELVHVFALEASGFSAPFIDEGIATALANEPLLLLLKDPARCSSIRALISNDPAGYAALLDGDRFKAAHGEGWAYPLAQLTVQGWIERVGLSQVMKVVASVARDREPALNAIERLIEPREATNRWLAAQVQLQCAGLASN